MSVPVRTFTGPRLAYDDQGFPFDPMTQLTGTDPPQAIVRRSPFRLSLRPRDVYTYVGRGGWPPKTSKG
jgi:hypothetical protein